MRKVSTQSLFLGAALLVGLSASVAAQTVSKPVSAPKSTPAKAGPQRDVQIEMRQIEEGGSGYRVGTQPSRPLLVAQQVLVRNGERATLQLGQSIPLQWVKSVQSQSGSLAAGDATATLRGGAVTQELMWLQAGQALSVRPQWPGGKAPVTLEIELQSAEVDAQAGAALGSSLPAQSRSQLLTTVTAPLETWVTVARTGASAARGSYSSQGGQTAPRLLQLRVQLP